jgi:RTX calcium-binding nonapeptide repeat (4 copies)
LRQEFIRHSSPIARVVALINVAGLITPPSSKEVAFMRRTILLLSTMVLALLLASGVALAVNKVGTNAPDTLRGTNTADILLGRDANDILIALAGDDKLLGERGKDIVFGGNERRRDVGRLLGGHKNMVGGRGNDSVVGGRGSDHILGEEGNDLLLDGPEREFATDMVSAGEGNDVVAAVNKPGSKT